MSEPRENGPLNARDRAHESAQYRSSRGVAVAAAALSHSSRCRSTARRSGAYGMAATSDASQKMGVSNSRGSDCSHGRSGVSALRSSCSSRSASRVYHAAESHTPFSQYEGAGETEVTCNASFDGTASTRSAGWIVASAATPRSPPNSERRSDAPNSTSCSGAQFLMRVSPAAQVGAGAREMCRGVSSAAVHSNVSEVMAIAISHELTRELGRELGAQVHAAASCQELAMLGLAALCCAAAVLRPPTAPSPSRRHAVGFAAAAIALPLGLPAPASAKILKASASQRKEAAEKAREYKFSKPLYDPEDPNQGTPEFLANARRRSDYESGLRC